MNQRRGFFAKLFDFSFSTFVAPQVVGVLYILGLIGAVLFALIAVVNGFQFSPIEGVITLIASLVGLLVYSIVLRVSLESFIAIIRTAENTRVLAENVLNNPADSSRPE
ncbi:DUF4282 domain-containing protein [Leptolyngbya sp. BC1307]|uniref:DUF4282 domain-containing protein n=1 Tax=Leptolyngbya sp. BC1307 TaxID=2029589 RepID=UPI00148201E6|nr:DUF4282 domain-containing protein [Leptolyngbya sp. BC1307]